MSTTTRTITAAELRPGDTFVKDDQRLTVTDQVAPSDTWDGYTRIGLGFGVLYALSDEQVTVVNSTDDAGADVIVGPNGSVADETNAHHFTTAVGVPIAIKLQLTVPSDLATEDEIAEWIGRVSQRIITAGGPGTTLTVHVGDGQ